MKRSTFQCFQRKCFNLNALSYPAFNASKLLAVPRVMNSCNKLLSLHVDALLPALFAMRLFYAVASVFICLSYNWTRVKYLVWLTGKYSARNLRCFSLC